MPNFTNPPPQVLSLRPGDPPIYLFGVPNTAAAVATVANGGATRLGNVVSFTTKAAHNFVIGQSMQAVGIGASGNTHFDGNYLILTVPTTTTLSAIPLDSANLNQPNDTGGGGNLFSVAAEQPAAPQASIAVALADVDAHANSNLSLEVFFTGAPGSFEIDLQEADSFVDGAFTFLGSNKVTAVSAVSNAGRVDLVNLITARFVRLNLVSRTNAVGLVAKVSR